MLSASIVLGFPYADVPEMGSSVVVTADGDPLLAKRIAGELAGELWNRRTGLAGRFISVEAALDEAASRHGSVGLLDMGDNVGGGSPGDGTHIARALRERRMGPSIACLCDPDAVRAARAAGIGGRARFAVGGKADRLHGEPLEGEFEIVSLHGGRFEELEVRHGGMSSFDQGPSAVVRDGSGLTILITSLPVPPFSLRQLTSRGIEPGRFRYLVLKGVNAPVAAYKTVCESFIRVDTPGSTSADLRRLEYKRRRRPMSPFEPETEWQPTERSIAPGEASPTP